MSLGTHPNKRFGDSISIIIYLQATMGRRVIIAIIESSVRPILMPSLV